MTPSDTMHRRAFLWKSGAGFGALALDQLLAETEEAGTIGMSPPHRHHPPRALQVSDLRSHQ